MTETRTDLKEIIEYIHPADLTYQEWVNVGMALKHEGYSVDIWDAWSRRDPGRYHAHECEKKWKGFYGSSSPVTGGTLVQMAMEHGWKPAYGGHEMSWDDEIDLQGAVLDASWIEGQLWQRILSAGMVTSLFIAIRPGRSMWRPSRRRALMHTWQITGCCPG